MKSLNSSSWVESVEVIDLSFLWMWRPTRWPEPKVGAPVHPGYPRSEGLWPQSAVLTATCAQAPAPLGEARRARAASSGPEGVARQFAEVVPVLLREAALVEEAPLHRHVGDAHL